LNLLSVPVKAYSAAVPGGGKIGFHQLHTECHSRIRYEKVCPIHGEVTKDEIVSGYEFAKGKYAIVTDKDLEKLHPDNDQTIHIDVFVQSTDIDPMYYADRSYYLVPDGRVAEKPYAVLQRVMAERERFAIAQMILSGREQLVLVRPLNGLLAMTVLHYEDQIKKPAEFEGDVPDVSVSDKELSLAESLVDASTADDFDFASYKDQYTNELAKMLEAKAEGKTDSAPKHREEPAVVNLMEALKKSLEHAKRGGAAAKRTTAKKTPAKAAAGSSRTRRAVSRRKTG
jgi:DNA end-binding protein Ku